MLVETYEEVEQTTGPEATVGEEVALIESLGLKGQAERIRRDGEVSLNPYRLMLKDEQAIYAEICPARTDVSEYAAGPIPLRVLQVVSHARQFFPKIMVWHQASAREKDPVLVGYEKNEWSSKPFILARWGAELEPLDVLAVKAGQKRRARVVSKLRQAIMEFESATDDGVLALDNVHAQ